jgi:hypothetical protein
MAPLVFSLAILSLAEPSRRHCCRLRALEHASDPPMGLLDVREHKRRNGVLPVASRALEPFPGEHRAPAAATSVVAMDLELPVNPRPLRWMRKTTRSTTVPAKPQTEPVSQLRRNSGGPLRRAPPLELTQP